MADNKLLQQMLEHLVNDEQQKAEELFHEYVVAKSREIYESLIEDELDEASKEEDEDEEMDEAAKDDDAEEEKVDEAAEEDEDMDENFEEVAIEGDDEMPPMGGDATDDLEGDLEGGDEMGEKSEEELFQDLDAIVDELQAKFDELKGGEEGEMDMGDEEMKDDFELETVREYVEKVSDGHGAEKKGKAETADNTKSTIDNMKNDMGGTTANILSGRNGADAGSVGAGGKIKGSALSDQNPKEDNAGNINVPGGKAGNAFSKKEPGHGAEKKGAAEQADNKQSLFRGRR
jgi:hypothetical protein